MTTVVVTGASGHVGANLVRALLSRGDAVRATVRADTRALDGLDLELCRAELLDGASLRRALAGAGVVYHLAAGSALEGTADPVNVEGTRNVAAACLACGVARMIHCSSIKALAPAEVTDERCPLVDEGPPYHRSKAEAERLLLGLHGLAVTIVNPTGVIGPHDHKASPMGQVLLRLFRGGMPALVEGGFDWVDARDVAGGMIAAAERGRPGERYILGGRWASLRELAQLAGAAAGVRPPRLVSPMWLARLGAPFSETACKVMGWRPLYSSASLDNLAGHGVVSHAKAADELGYAPRPLRETVEDTYRWCREAGLV